MKKTILLSFILISFTAISCSDNTNGNESEEFVIPDLEFSYSVSGHITQSDSWESPENNPELANHTRGVIAVHSKSTNGVAISGAGPDYGLRVAFEAENITTGTFTLGDASFSNGQGDTFARFQSGTIKFDEVELNFSANGQTFYIVSGSWTASIQDGSLEPNSIVFSAQFTGLSLASS